MNKKNGNNKSKSPKTYYGLDTRKIVMVDLGQHPSIHGALTRRNAEFRSYSRIVSAEELAKFKDVLKNVKAGAYYYLNNENQLVSMGTFKNDAEAKQHALVNLFGVTKLMVAAGTRMRRAIDNLTPPTQLPAAVVSQTKEVPAPAEEVAVTA